MTTKLMFSNLKGGVGKTTNSVMISYELAKRGYKTLICDLDPQSNATQLLLRTYSLQNQKELTVPSTMMRAIQDNNLPAAVVKIMKNLYLIPSAVDFYHYPKFLMRKFYRYNTKNHFNNYYFRMIYYFNQLIGPIENKFDYIIFDVPPTIDMFVESALMDTNYIIIVMQTQQRSLDGAIAFSKYVQQFINKYYPRANFDFAGVLPVIMKKSSPLDHVIIKKAQKIFGVDSLFNTVIHFMERLKRYDAQGISEKGYTKWNDFHDTKVNRVYNKLTDEIIKRTKGGK